MGDLIDRQAAIEAINQICPTDTEYDCTLLDKVDVKCVLTDLPSAQPTIYGYNVEHLELIARIMQKENVPPEKVVGLLTDIERIGAIISDEFEEALKKAVEQCTI